MRVQRVLRLNVCAERGSAPESEEEGTLSLTSSAVTEEHRVHGQRIDGSSSVGQSGGRAGVQGLGVFWARSYVCPISRGQASRGRHERQWPLSPASTAQYFLSTQTLRRAQSRTEQEASGNADLASSLVSAVLTHQPRPPCQPPAHHHDQPYP
jgi:hypothetical protein